MSRLLFFGGERWRQERVPMSEMVGAIAVVGVVVVGLGVLVGKIRPGDAMGRIGAFVLLLVLAPIVAFAMKSALAALWKHALLLVALILVVTGFVRLVGRLFS